MGAEGSGVWFCEVDGSAGGLYRGGKRGTRCGREGGSGTKAESTENGSSTR